MTAALATRLPVTLELVALAAAWVIGIGVPLGVLSAVRSGSSADLWLRGVMSLLLATPSFWLASLALMLPQQWWSYAPPLDGARSLIHDPAVNLIQFLPASLVLAATPMASVLRITRTAVIATLDADFVRTAHAKGLSPRLVLTHHVLRVAIPPVLSLLGVIVGGLLGGSVIVESIFNLNGVAQYFLRSVMQKDFAPAQAIALYVAAGVVAVNLLADTAHAIVDPRLRTSR